jgi:hypothetical protein
VNSDRSPSSTSWISRTYGGSGSASGSSASGSLIVAGSTRSSVPGFLASSRSSICPSPESEKVSAFAWAGSPFSGRSGVRSTMVTRCSLAAIRLPVRSRNGTPFQRALSIHSLAATKVSVFDRRSMPSTSR